MEYRVAGLAAVLLFRSEIFVIFSVLGGIVLHHEAKYTDWGGRLGSVGKNSIQKRVVQTM